MGTPSEAALTTIDWERDAVWVQDRTMYLVAETPDPDAEEIRLRDQIGNEVTLSRSDLARTHVPVQNATVYKRRFEPVRAICLNEDSVVGLGEGAATLAVAAGDALLCDAAGNVSVLPRHEFNCRYRFVAAAGPQPV